MLKPSWWLLGAGAAHFCSAVAGWAVGIVASNQAYTLYTKHMIAEKEKALFENRITELMSAIQPRENTANERIEKLKAQLRDA